MAFEYDTLDDLMKTYLRLKKIGVVPAACLNHGMTTSFYYRDPDGNYVEMQVDNFGPDPAVSTAFMHTPAFLANPIGVPINPESYVAAWQQGASLCGIARAFLRGRVRRRCGDDRYRLTSDGNGNIVSTLARKDAHVWRVSLPGPIAGVFKLTSFSVAIHDL